MQLRPREYLLTFNPGDTEQQFQVIAPFRAFAVRLGRRAYPQPYLPFGPYNAPIGPWIATPNVDAWVSSLMIAGEEQIAVPGPGGMPVEVFRTPQGQGLVFPAMQVASAFKVTLTEPAREAFALTVCGQEVP